MILHTYFEGKLLIEAIFTQIQRLTKTGQEILSSILELAFVLNSTVEE
jgi:hypothetical protein